MDMDAKAEPTEASEPAASTSVTDGVLPNAYGSSDSAGRGLPRCDSGVSDVGREVRVPVTAANNLRCV